MNNENTVKKAERNETIMIVTFLLLVSIVAIGFSTGVFYIKEDPVETRSWNDTWCLQDVIPANGGSFGEPSGGTYEYTLIARSNGTVEVWKECE